MLLQAASLTRPRVLRPHPRAPRQKAQPKRRLFNNLPQSKRALPQPMQMQQHATVPDQGGRGATRPQKSPVTGNRHRLPAPGSRLPAPSSQLPAPGSRLPAPGCLSEAKTSLQLNAAVAACSRPEELASQRLRLVKISARFQHAVVQFRRQHAVRRPEVLVVQDVGRPRRKVEAVFACDGRVHPSRTCLLYTSRTACWRRN